MKEKRKVERFDLELGAILSFEDAAEDSGQQKLFSLDVSSAGVFLLTKNPLPSGSRVKVDLLLSQDLIQQEQKSMVCINSIGTVIRINDRGMAIAFDERHEISTIELH
jgi:hypothetical protein